MATLVVAAELSIILKSLRASGRGPSSSAGAALGLTRYVIVWVGDRLSWLPEATLVRSI